jgi:hypothetical protein
MAREIIKNECGPGAKTKRHLSLSGRDDSGNCHRKRSP